MIEDSIQAFLSDTENLEYLATLTTQTPYEWFMGLNGLINHFKMKGVL
jgi:hypothetical protein